MLYWHSPPPSAREWELVLRLCWRGLLLGVGGVAGCEAGERRARVVGGSGNRERGLIEGGKERGTVHGAVPGVTEWCVIEWVIVGECRDRKLFRFFYSGGLWRNHGLFKLAL